MLVIKKTPSLSELAALKHAYVQSACAPLDGMWLCGFVPQATHFSFYESDESLIGFCCINDDGYLLQFFLSEQAVIRADELFVLIMQQNSSVIRAAVGDIKGAFVSTAESAYLSLCLDNMPDFKVNSLMYHLVDGQQKDTTNNQITSALRLTLATTEQLTLFVEFAVAAMGAPEQWLQDYYNNLIDRGELYGYWDGGRLLAAGECRGFDDYQQEYADLGVIVAAEERGRGLATGLLQALIGIAVTQNKRPMCSTGKNNIGAQKAIQKAGFRSQHRIVQFDL